MKRWFPLPDLSMTLLFFFNDYVECCVPWLSTSLHSCVCFFSCVWGKWKKKIPRILNFNNLAGNNHDYSFLDNENDNNIVKWDERMWKFARMCKNINSFETSKKKKKKTLKVHKMRDLLHFTHRGHKMGCKCRTERNMVTFNFFFHEGTHNMVLTRLHSGLPDKFILSSRFYQVSITAGSGWHSTTAKEAAPVTTVLTTSLPSPPSPPSPYHMSTYWEFPTRMVYLKHDIK